MGIYVTSFLMLLMLLSTPLLNWYKNVSVHTHTHTHTGTILQIYELNLSDWSSYIKRCIPSLPIGRHCPTPPWKCFYRSLASATYLTSTHRLSTATAGALFVCLFLEFLPLNIAFWIYLLTQTKEERQQDEDETEQNRTGETGSELKSEKTWGAGGRRGLGREF